MALLLACAPAATGALELNAASQAELESLKGIGTALSARLLAARSEAPFADWHDALTRVPGLGPASATRLSAEGLRVNGAVFSSGAGPMTAKAPRRASSSGSPASPPAESAASASRVAPASSAARP